MSQTIAFDTLAYAKRLKEVGVPEKQAEVQAEAMVELVEERLATKQDILDLQRVTQQDILDLKRDMKEMEMRMTIRLGTLMMAAVGIVAALVKLL